MIKRAITGELKKSAREYPVVTVLGPRQSGKTTLVKMTFPRKEYASLEDPDVRMTAEADPRGFLDNMKNGGIIDEVQRYPAILSYIQGIVDAEKKPGRFILTGSHQPEMHQAISQSLAGRTAVLELWPFSFGEMANYKKKLEPFELVASGCFPRLYDEGLDSRRFFNGYVRTYVERDVSALLGVRDLSRFQQFLVLLAGRTGQVINYTSLSNDVGVSGTTIKDWISVLKASYVVFELRPYSMNIRKRVVKSPKIYFTDAGLAAYLIGVHTALEASRDPLRGNLYENLVIAEAAKCALNRGIRPDLYFYRDSNGHEVDLVIREGGKLIPVEIKSSKTFSSGFLKNIEHFEKLGLKRVSKGAVLYNGRRMPPVRGVKVFNPVAEQDIWKILASQ